MLLRDPWSDTDPNADIYVSFRDIALLAEEMGTPLSSIPASHDDAASFSSNRPFLGQEFDLVFCDGQVLRTHERAECKSTSSVCMLLLKSTDSYVCHLDRERCEASRLLTSQLVLALQRIRSGGTMVILLHKADRWQNVLLMYTFTTFADYVTLFKPPTAHRTRSSFYLVAKGVRPEREAALEAVRQWKAKWSMVTFRQSGDGEDERGEVELEVLGSGGEEKVNGVLQEFGPDLVKMVEPVFRIQAEALRNASWMKNTGGP